jgi:hypothetical protein
MEQIVKCPKRQDCYFKLSPGSSNETSINLSNAVFAFIMPEGVPSGKTIDVSFQIYKEDFIKALCNIVGIMPLYKTASGRSQEVQFDPEFFTAQCDVINGFFGQDNVAVYHAKLYNRDEGRKYLNNLDDNGFNIRRFLVESNSVLLFQKDSDDLCSLRIESGEDVYKKYAAKEVEIGIGNIVASNSILRSFILDCIEVIDEREELKEIVPFIDGTITLESPIKIASSEYGFSLTGMFLETTEEDLQRRNSTSQRWFEKEFSLDGHTVYLSTQWNEEGDYQLMLDDFLKLLDVCFPGTYRYSKEGGRFTLRVVPPPVQKVYYGAPGTGKSYKIKHEVIPSGVEPYRVTFYSDFYYSDFVGGLRPKNSEMGIEYAFEAGPFAKALRDSFFKPTYLIIEEINRGNAAAIFGDIFQLLDRERGRSEYSITNHDLYQYLVEEGVWGLEKDKVYLPSNLNILCTMNTADQNVFVLDTAFKRRFKMEYVPIDFNVYYESNNPDNGVKTKCKVYLDNNSEVFNGEGYNEDLSVVLAPVFEIVKKNVGEPKRNWPTFASFVNAKIDEINKVEQKISEDKKLGPFFVGAEELEDRKSFADKVLYYLKQDVFKYEDSILIDSYEALYAQFVYEQKDIFEMI